MSAYRLSFEDFTKGGKTGPLCKDELSSASMFRVVFKSNLTQVLAEDLFCRISEIINHIKEIELDVSANETKIEMKRDILAARTMTSFRGSMVMRKSELRRKSRKNSDLFTNEHAAC